MIAVVKMARKPLQNYARSRGLPAIQNALSQVHIHSYDMQNRVPIAQFALPNLQALVRRT